MDGTKDLLSGEVLAFHVDRTAKRRYSRAELENLLSFSITTGDFLAILLGFVAAFWVRYDSGWFFPVAEEVYLVDYLPLLGFGGVMVFWGLVGRNISKAEHVLNPRSIQAPLLMVLTVCLFAFIGITLVVHTTPPISRGLVLFSWFTVFFSVYGWRMLVLWALRGFGLAKRLRRRVVVIGAGAQTVQILQRLAGKPSSEFVGWVQTNRPNKHPELEGHCLGSLQDLGSILKEHAADMVVLTDSDSIQLEGTLYVARICEREHVQFKLVPHFFQAFISGLRPSMLGGVPLLGVESLPLGLLQNQLLKRAMDVAGATVGLLLSAPLIAVFGLLVRLESPGPVFFGQVRVGRNGRNFTIYKIRSMGTNAEADGKARWCVENDPRRLKVGSFMRRWNIDEVPQFWNVLKGEMSLIGPRPERPELIENFQRKIAHYQLRHSCLPGMSGWAQVNGLRGNTSLEQRIQHDIWYVENWSIWLDIRIIAMTFFHQQNAY